MRTITLHDGTVKKYREACDAIERVREKDPQKAEEMEKSLGESCKVLMRILMNSDLEEEYGIEKGSVELSIAPDFVNGSFSFVFTTKDRGATSQFNGGMILHGFGETFSVELSAKSGPHWSIHT